MRRLRLVPVLAAVTLVVVTVLCARRALDSCQRFLVAINRHDVALSHTDPPLGLAPPAASRRVVLVIVDGLGHWASTGLPTIDRLRARGVDAVALSHTPSLSRPNYTSILTGVPPMHSGVRTNEYEGEIALDSLPRRVAAGQLRSAFVTDVAASVATLYRGAFTEVAYANWSGGFQDATELALARAYPLVVLLPGAVDACGHERRMSSRACDRATREVDRYLGAVAAQLDLTRDTLIITADHGHVRSGGHGGDERAVIEVPLVMVGAGVVPGVHLDGPRLIDLSPTIAALLGVAAPRHGLGMPLVPALALAPATRATLAADAAARVARNTAVVAVEQAEGRAARRARLPAAYAAIAGAAVALVLALTLLHRLRAIRLDRWSVALGVLTPLVAVCATFIDSDCLGSLSGFASLEEWTERALFAIVATTTFLLIATAVRRHLTADDRLTTRNGVMAVALATGGLWELGMSCRYASDPFVVLPGETTLFLLVATPVVLVALFIAVAAWRTIELIAFVARLHGPIPIVAAAAAATLAACGGSAPRAPGAAAVAPPKVVVLVVVDQLPAWSFDAKARAATGGFAELARRGRRYVGRTPYAATATAPGHAALSTGAPPAVTGIIGNEWWDRGLRREVKSVEDPAGGVSSARLRVEGVADTLQRTRPGSRAIGVALKDRSAVLALGRTGVAVWYDPARPGLVSNVRPRLPWLRDLADPRAFAARFDATWTPLDAARLARLSGSPDDAPGELAVPGWGATFPHAASDLPDAASAVSIMPLGNRVVVDAAIAAIGDLDLADGAPDYLAVSFSAHDYIGHAFGPDSWEAWDAFLRLDADLGALIAVLDRAAGRDGWAMILTSDHGAPALPERRRAAGLPGVRYTYEDVDAIAERAAAVIAGPGAWVASTRAPYVYLSAEAEALPRATRTALLDAIVRALAATPGIARVWRTRDLVGDCETRAGDERALCRSIDPRRAGDLMYSPAAGASVSPAASLDAVSHGTVHAYDREVPLIVVAPGVVAGGGSRTIVSTLRVAPTLAELLGIPPPPAAREASLLHGDVTELR